ncbi:MAG: uroporphyrinogen-III synthase, partial [Burkholderiales bacterium]
MTQPSAPRAAPLSGKRIVITRPAGQAEPLARLVREAGGEPLLVPAIEIRPLEDAAPFHALAQRLEDFDLAIFVSRNAVKSALALLAGRPWPARLRVAAVGQGSREELERAGFADVIAPAARSDSEALLALPALAGMRGRRVVIFRGDAGRQLLGDELGKGGATVEYAACYRRVRPAGEGLAALWARGVDAVALSSAEGLANFMAMLGEGAVAKLAAVALFVPHERVAREAARRGLP